MPKLSVLLVGPHKDAPGGVATFTRELSEYLIDREDIEFNYVSVGSGVSAAGGSHVFRDQFSARRQIKSLQPGIVHVNPSFNMKSVLRDGLIARAAARRKIPVISFIHGWSADFANALQGGANKLFLRSLGVSSAFVVLADEFRDALRDLGISVPIYVGRTFVPRLVMEEAHALSAKRYTPNDGPFRLLFLSRLETDKGIFDLLEGVERLLDEGRRVELFVGGEGTQSGRIAAILSRKSRLRSAVTLLGYVTGDDKHAALRNADVFCLPTFHEGLPIAVLEAMSVGLPVIATNVGGLKSALSDGETGFVINARDPSDIAAKIRYAMDNKDILVNISRHNEGLARRLYSLDSVGNFLVDLYHAHAKTPNYGT